jgi:hypothetical protein
VATYLRPPSSLPLFLVAGHGFRDDDPFATRPRGSGHHRKRRVRTASTRFYGVSWLLTGDQAAAADSWGENSLLVWTRRFIAQVQTEEGLRYWDAAWIEEPSWTPLSTPGGVIWRVEGGLEVFGEWTDEPPETGEIAAENTLELEAEGDVLARSSLLAENTLELDLSSSLRAENTLELEVLNPFFLLLDDGTDPFYLLIDDDSRLRIS